MMIDPDSPEMAMLTAMIEADPELRAALQQALGVGQPWPYEDLKLRCPHCPVCGDEAQIIVGPGIHPIAWCTNDDCTALNWDPTVPARELVLGARRTVTEETVHNGITGTVTRPENDEEWLARITEEQQH